MPPVPEPGGRRPLVYMLSRKPLAQPSRRGDPPESSFRDDSWGHGPLDTATAPLASPLLSPVPTSRPSQTRLQSSCGDHSSVFTPTQPLPQTAVSAPVRGPPPQGSPGSFHTSKPGHVCLLLRASLTPHRFRTKSEIPCSQALVPSLASGLPSSALAPQRHPLSEIPCVPTARSHRRAHALASPPAACASLRSPGDCSELASRSHCPPTGCGPHCLSQELWNCGLVSLPPRKAQGGGGVTTSFVHHPRTAVPRAKLTTF